MPKNTPIFEVSEFTRMTFTYPAKVLLAWSEAIDGNKAIEGWLMDNGYKELGIFVYALHNKDDARSWLMENGFEHLAATIAGAEGSKSALKWLVNYQFDILEKVAKVADGDTDAFGWLLKNNHRELAMVGKKMESVKDEIERENNDIHKISKE